MSDNIPGRIFLFSAIFFTELLKVSFTIGWVASWLGNDPKEVTYNSSMPTNVLLTYQALLIVITLVCIYILQHYQRKLSTTHKRVNIDGKIEEVRKRIKALKAREAVFCSLNFGRDRQVRIGKFAADTDIEKLREAIRMIEDAIEKQMKFTSELCDYIQPFIKDLTGDGILPEDMELEDVLAMLQLFAAYLEEKEPVRARAPQRGEIIYPHDLEERVEKIKDKLKKLDDLIVIRQSTSHETLMYVSRIGKIQEIKEALRDLDNVLKKRSQESVANLLANTENPIETRPDEKCGTLANVPSSTYLADAESAGRSTDEDDGTQANIPGYTGLTGTRVDDSCRTQANSLCFTCLGNPERKTDVSDVENSGTQARVPFWEDHEELIDRSVDKKCGGPHANATCSPCLFDPDDLSDTSSD